MRVAMDASMLALPPSGTATYVRALSAALRANFPDLDVEPLEPAWDDDAIAGPIGRVTGNRRLRRFLWDAFGSGRAARRVTPDLLHVPRFAAPVWAPCPLVVTIHDVIPLVMPAYRGSRAMRAHLALMTRTALRARVILTPSRAAAADIERELGIQAERIRVTPEAADPSFRPGVDPEEINGVRQRYGIGERYVFNVGGLDVRKNLAVLIEAFAEIVRESDDPVDLVIAGAAHSENPLVFPPLEPVVRRLGLTNRVRLVGRVSEAEKLALYRGAALYVTPSLYEGFGLTALEAMACGIPTVAARRTSLPEVVGDGGLLVEPTVEALADAMRSVLGDPALAQDLAGRGVARAARFSWDETARLTRAAYDDALQGS